MLILNTNHATFVSFLCFILLEKALVTSLSVPRIAGVRSVRGDVVDFPTFNHRANHAAPPTSKSTLFANLDDDDDTAEITMSESDQLALGAAGSIASLITLYSESVLKSTGCGLPAGPFGLVGAAEGLSYLGVVGIASFSLYKKIKTGSGLPAGPAGILGAAEGLSFLAIAAGLIVLVLQITNYGYIPNAVPMEGGMCQ